MTGIYNADQLISVMQQIGNAKHTLVLLDDALPIVERRRLARKTKNELGDKFIGVLDRVVMMYLFATSTRLTITGCFSLWSLRSGIINRMYGNLPILCPPNCLSAEKKSLKQ